jgi:hypothetical protein
MRQRSSRGSALATALVVLLVVFSVGSGLLGLSMHMMRRGRLDALRVRALALADAGVEKAIYYLRTGAPDGSKLATWRTNGYTETVTGQGDYTIVVKDGEGDNEGHIVVTCIGHSSDTVVASAGGGGGAAFISWLAGGSMGPTETKRAVRVVLDMAVEDISIWNNAIFGGVGQGGRSIQGNVRMRGGVHLLGDGEAFTDADADQRWDSGEPYNDGNNNGKYDVGESYTDTDADGHYDARETFDDVNGNGTRDPALTVTDLASDISGDANVGNNYDGMPSELRNMIPDAPKVKYKGETVESLSSKLRAKHGRVNISGSATVGEPQATGGSPAIKETMAGTYVSDGFGGSEGASHVYSDNGTSKKYNLGDLVKFPTLTEPTVKNGVSYATYMDYLKANAVVIDGNLDLKPGDTYAKTDGTNSIVVDATGNITITGIVYVQGDIKFSKDGGNKRMTYLGKGTLTATGNIEIDTDIVPKTGKFPTDNHLGLISRHKMSLAKGSGASQLTLCGAFYAQEMIDSNMQNELAGTFVSSYFNMQNVPHMYQVPALVQNLPPGMPGAGSIYIVSPEIYSWRETTVPADLNTITG